jgi:hypothetical protein
MILVCDCRIYTLRLPENREMDVNKCPTSSPQLYQIHIGMQDFVHSIQITHNNADQQYFIH